MSELDDLKEFTETVENAQDLVEALRKKRGSTASSSPSYDDDEAELAPGRPSQWSLYGPGFTATTPTIKSLPAGSYDIGVDSKCVFAVPSITPSGLLLELPEMRSDYVIKLVETFLNSEKDYKEGNEFVIGGAAYKAGIMIYGPPGSGKSCTIKLVCKKLIERGGTVFNASIGPDHVALFLTEFSQVENNRKSIVILEDIDSLIENYGEAKYLEMLDSAKTIDNVLFIATTNYPERLDPRIYNRPGRFSHVVKIGLPTPSMRGAYLRAILKNHKDVEEIVTATNGFTIDHLTALINAVYREKKDLKHEIERLRTLFKVPKAGEQSKLGINASGWDASQ